MGNGVSRTLLAFDQGDGTWTYQYERPRYSWAETITRPKILKPDGAVLCARLGSDWVPDYGGGLTQVCGTCKPVAASPAVVANELLTLERSLMPRLQ
jgi:hypothetical protein